VVVYEKPVKSTRREGRRSRRREVGKRAAPPREEKIVGPKKFPNCDYDN